MRNNFFSRNKKILIIFSPLFLMSIIIYLFFFHLNILFSLGFRVCTYGTIKANNVVIEEGSTLHKGIIEIENSKMFYNKELIADTPKIIIKYNEFKIEEINIYDSKVKFVRNGSSTNFVEVFTGPEKDDSDRKVNKKEEKKEKKNEPILKKINVYNADLNYVDRSYSEEISQIAHNVNGYIDFNKGYKVLLEFSGKNNEEDYYYTFNNLEKSYDMTIRAKNIRANHKLVQYGYDSEGDITEAKGTMNLDLRINEDGFFGTGKLIDGEVFYKDLGVPVNNVDLDLKFLGESIIIDGDFIFLKNKGLFKVDYQSDKGVLVNFKFEDIPYKDVANYKYLKESNLEFDDLILNDVDIKISKYDNFKVAIDFKSQDGFNKSILFLNDIDGSFVYENNEMRLDDLQAKMKLINDGDLIERNLKGSLVYKNDKGKVKINLQGDEEDFLSNVNLNLIFNLQHNGINFKLDSSILDLIGKYNYKNKKLSITQKNNFEFVYDFSNKKIAVLEGYLNSKLDQYKMKTEINLEKDNLLTVDSKIESEIIQIDKNKKSKKNKFGIKLSKELKKDFKTYKKIGDIKGKIDIDKLIYNFKADIKNMALSYKDIKYSGNIKGYLKGERGTLKGEFNIDDTNFEMETNKLKIEKILGTIYLKKIDDFSLIFQGEIGGIKYDEYELNGFKISAKLQDNNVNILNARNKFLTLKGNYSIIKSKLDLFIKGVELNKDTVKIKDFDYNIDEIDGHVFGYVSNLKGNFIVKNGEYIFSKDRKFLFGGDINYFNKHLFSRRFLINKNEIFFNFNIDKKTGTYGINVFEDTLSNEIQGLKFKITGKSLGAIKGDKIKGKFKGSINSSYYRGAKIPDILVNCMYDNDEVDFKEISILSLIKKDKILTLRGIVDIKDKSLDFKLPSQKMALEKIVDMKEISGDINIQGELSGPFNEIKYSIEGKNGSLTYKNISTGDINFSLVGDTEKAKLNGFNINYEGNNIFSYGEYDIPSSKYKLKIDSENIDLNFIAPFLAKYGIDEVSGRGDIDLLLTDVIPEGTIKFERVRIKSKKYGIDAHDFIGNFDLNKGFLKIKKLSGILNDGTLNMNGYLEMKKTLDSFLEANIKEANYSLVLDGRNINYSFEDYFKINLNTRMNMKNNRIFGNILINEGEINKIINQDYGLVKIIKDFLKDFFNRNKVNKMIIDSNDTLIAEDKNDSEFAINIGFKIDKGIKIRVDEATSFVKDLRGTLFGQGTLKGPLGKINFLGENDVRDGEFILNGNKFNVDRAIVLFNNRDEYIPDLNPNINLSINSVIDNKNTEFTLDGPFKNLTFTVRRGNTVSVNSLDSIIDDKGIKSDDNKEISVLLANLIGGQITDIVLNPVVKVLRRIGFKDFRLRSSIVTEETKRNEMEDSSMVFGAYVEAESPLYKDKIFWRIKANFMEDSKDYPSKNVQNEYGIVDYDVNLYHKLNKNVSWGVGAQKLKEDLEKKSNHDVNYYIELKFEKRFNFRNGGLE